MPVKGSADRQVGLKSIRDAREQRARGKFARPTGVMWIALGLGIATVLGSYTWISGRKLDVRRNDLLAKQNAVLATVGKEWAPLDKTITDRIIEASKGWPGDLRAPSAPSLDIDKADGLYIRLRLEDATDAESIRTHAAMSVRDGVVGCLVRGKSEATQAKTTDASTFVDRPWNLRQAYAATRILGDIWRDEVKSSNDDLRLRIFEEQYERAIDQEIPLAVRMIKRSRYLLVVLDEAGEGEPKGDPQSLEERQLHAHPTRVRLVDLEHKRDLLRSRTSVSAAFMHASGQDVVDPAQRAAMQRQVNNCALANHIRERLEGAPRATPVDSAADAGITPTPAP